MRIQASGLVPIVEPEVMLDGEHDIDRTLEVAEAIWAQTFKYMADNKVMPLSWPCKSSTTWPCSCILLRGMQLVASICLPQNYLSRQTRANGWKVFNSTVRRFTLAW